MVAAHPSANVTVTLSASVARALVTNAGFAEDASGNWRRSDGREYTLHGAVLDAIVFLAEAN